MTFQEPSLNFSFEFTNGSSPGNDGVSTSLIPELSSFDPIQTSGKTMGEVPRKIAIPTSQKCASKPSNNRLANIAITQLFVRVGRYIGYITDRDDSDVGMASAPQHWPGLCLVAALIIWSLTSRAAAPHRFCFLTYRRLLLSLPLNHSTADTFSLQCSLYNIT